jgi:hypothetical protein
MSAMQEGRLNAKKEASQPPPSPTATQVDWVSERKGMDKYLAYAGKGDEPKEKQLAFVFERSGFSTWKLTEVRMPLNR